MKTIPVHCYMKNWAMRFITVVQRGDFSFPTYILPKISIRVKKPRSATHRIVFHVGGWYN